MSIVRPKDKTATIESEEHVLYRSGCGILLYLVKHTRLDIANPVRELSKVLDCPTLASWKELLRVVKYVMDTKEKGLKIFPKKEMISEKGM